MRFSFLRQIKSKFYSKIAEISLGHGNGEYKPHANNFTWLGSRCRIGNNCNFNGMKISGAGEVTIGDNFHSGESCLILTSNHNYEGLALPYDSTTIDRDVSIGKNVWVGSRVIILPGSIIADGCIIQAGSVVIGEIPKCAIAGGHPATIFAYRDKEHYERLEKQGKYC